MRLRRPSARRMPSGADAVIPTRVRTTVSGSPPHMSVEMGERPKIPPSISAKKAKKAAAQPQRSHTTPRRFQKAGIVVTTSMNTMPAVAAAGRH